MEIYPGICNMIPRQEVHITQSTQCKTANLARHDTCDLNGIAIHLVWLANN